MPKVSEEVKKQILADPDKSNISRLIHKYGVSRGTVCRIIGHTSDPKKSEASRKALNGVNIPNRNKPSLVVKDLPVPKQSLEATSLEFVAIMNNDTPAEKEELFPKKESKKTVMEENAMEKATDALFGDSEGEEEEEDLPVVKKSKTVRLPAPPKANDDDERYVLTQRIILNVDNFLPLYNFIKDKDEYIRSLPKKSVAELDNILKTLENTRTVINLTNQFKGVFSVVVRGTEVIGSQLFRLKTQGLADNFASSQQEIDLILREIAIDYAPKMRITQKPELRLAMLYAMTVLQTDQMNRMKDMMRANQPPEQKVAEKYADL